MITSMIVYSIKLSRLFLQFVPFIHLLLSPLHRMSAEIRCQILSHGLIIIIAVTDITVTKMTIC